MTEKLPGFSAAPFPASGMDGAIGEDPEVVDALFIVFETREILSGSAEIIPLPASGAAGDLLTALEADRDGGSQAPPIARQEGDRP